MLKNVHDTIIALNRRWDSLDGLLQFSLLVLFALPMIMLPNIVAHYGRGPALAAVAWTFGLMIFRLYGHLARTERRG
jgi:hypothetical protein